MKLPPTPPGSVSGTLANMLNPPATAPSRIFRARVASQAAVCEVSGWQRLTVDNPDCFALMLEDESQAECTFSAIKLEEVVIVPSRWRQKATVSGDASRWRNPSRVVFQCMAYRATFQETDLH